MSLQKNHLPTVLLLSFLSLGMAFPANGGKGALGPFDGDELGQLERVMTKMDLSPEDAEDHLGSPFPGGAPVTGEMLQRLLQSQDPSKLWETTLPALYRMMAIEEVPGNTSSSQLRPMTAHLVKTLGFHFQNYTPEDFHHLFLSAPNYQAREVLTWAWGERPLEVRFEFFQTMVDFEIFLTERAYVKNLSIRNVDAKVLPSLLRVLARHPHVSMLDLSHNRISNETIQVIGELLEQNRTLNHLDLSFNQIDDYGTQLLSYYYMAGNQTLRSLNLVGNSISEEGGDVLEKLSQMNQKLEVRWRMELLHDDV